jgi:hypothetical protein
MSLALSRRVPGCAFPPAEPVCLSIANLLDGLGADVVVISEKKPVASTVWPTD